MTRTSGRVPYDDDVGPIYCQCSNASCGALLRLHSRYFPRHFLPRPPSLLRLPRTHAAYTDLPFHPHAPTRTLPHRPATAAAHPPPLHP